MVETELREDNRWYAEVRDKFVGEDVENEPIEKDHSMVGIRG